MLSLLLYSFLAERMTFVYPFFANVLMRMSVDKSVHDSCGHHHTEDDKQQTGCDVHSLCMTLYKLDGVAQLVHKQSHNKEGHTYAQRIDKQHTDAAYQTSGVCGGEHCTSPECAGAGDEAE